MNITEEAIKNSTTKRKEDEEGKGEDEKIDLEDKNAKKDKNAGKQKKVFEKAQAETIHENVKKMEKKKSPSDLNFILNCLRNHFVFYNLSESELENIVSKMFYCKVGAHEYIFKQGDNASSYFILERGTLEVIVNEKPKRELRTGDGFGELALLYNAPRSASVRTLENCELWGIDRNTFRRAVEEMITKEYEENRKFIEAVRFFNAMSSEQKDSIASVLITLKFAKGQNIVNEGDPGSSFYIIKEGSVVVLKGNKEIRKMVKGDSFGEQALFYNTVRGATVKALDNNCKCLALGRDTLIKVLGDQVQVITFRNQQKWALEKSPILSKLTKAQIEKVVDVMKIMNYKAGDVIYAKGSFCHQKIVTIIEGALKKSKFGTVVATKGGPFGDEYLMETNKTKAFDDDIIMESDGVLAEINYESFQECIGGPMEEVLKKNEKAHEKRLINPVSEIKKISVKLKLEELIYYGKLGAGQFGSVYLVREKNHEQFFALKCVSKQLIVEGNLEKHVQQEKAVLELINFPFIMQYIRTYRDNNFIYFLTEYIKGMELFDVIREMGLLNTYDAQFYLGSAILCIEYLHNQGIIYRDLRPENLMVDSNGYVKLIDLGTAKIMKKQGAAAPRTFTIIGTPHYMAPEIIIGKGYGQAVDLWSLGICLYEFMCGVVPFGEESEDPYDIYEEIFTQPLKYPSYLKDKKAKRLMDQLIHKYPEVRLGGSFAALKANPWFENFDWDKLLDKELKPPYIPPKEKLISDVDIKKMEGLGKKVIAEIDEDQKSVKRYNKDLAGDATWDKTF